MGLESSFNDLSTELEGMKTALIELHTTVTKFMPKCRPNDTEPYLLEQLGRTALDLRGLVEEAIDDAREGQKAIVELPNLSRTSRALASCQQRFTQKEQHFWSVLLACEQRSDLSRLPHKRGGAWHPWSKTVLGALGDCRQRLYELDQAFFRCWQELAERAGSSCVSVQTTSVGQVGR
jgi:hypothetical protein